MDGVPPGTSEKWTVHRSLSVLPRTSFLSILSCSSSRTFSIGREPSGLGCTWDVQPNSMAGKDREWRLKKSNQLMLVILAARLDMLHKLHKQLNLPPFCTRFTKIHYTTFPCPKSFEASTLKGTFFQVPCLKAIRTVCIYANMHAGLKKSHISGQPK